MLPAWMINDLRKKSTDDENVHAIYAPDHTPHSDRSDSSDDDNDDVLNAGSGGGPSPPPAPDPMAEAKAQMALEAERQRISDEKEAAAAEKAATKLAEDKTKYQSQLANAYNTAQSYGTNKLNQMGISDDYGIMSAYQGLLDKAKSTIPELDPSPGSYFTNSLWDEALGGAKTSAVNKLEKSYNAAVPEGFESTYIPDTMDDALIDAIIGQQYSDASDYIKRAQERGSLNDTGYAEALETLGEKKSGATAKANELGMGVLTTGRTGLSDIDKAAESELSNWDFGSNFDTGSYQTKISDYVKNFGTGLEGKLSNAFGDTSFFDTDALIATGGKAQGSTNPGAAALKDAISEEEKRRTAGSVGAF